jgi:arginyl-tRNA synthetase
MILPVHERLRTHLAHLLTTVYGLDAEAQPPLSFDYPPSRELGDLGTPVAFELARRLRQAPRAIAQTLAGAFGSLDGIRQVTAAPNGYLNVFLDRRTFLLDRLTGTSGTLPDSPRTAAGKAIVEHTAINPNKAAHVGHLRNTALGDTLVRVLRFRGVPVEVQNYIDDTGVQVADVVVGFRCSKAGRSRRCARRPTRRASITTAGTCTPASASGSRRTGARGRPGADAPRHRARRQRQRGHRRLHRRPHRPVPPRDHARMNVDYDLLTWEGDILRLKFWAQAFEVLKARQASTCGPRGGSPAAG